MVVGCLCGLDGFQRQRKGGLLTAANVDATEKHGVKPWEISAKEASGSANILDIYSMRGQGGSVL